MSKNKSAILFSVVIVLTLILLAILNKTLLSTNNYKSEIDKFEEKYNSVLKQLTDTLKQIKELDTNYVLQILPKFGNKQNYYYLDQDYNRGSNFTVPYFKLSENQVIFLKDIISDVQYVKKEKAFYLKPFYFKEGDNTLLLVIMNDSTTTPKISRQLYTKKDLHFYYITNAW